jgi:hypothetical protein
VDRKPHEATAGDHIKEARRLAREENTEAAWCAWELFSQQLVRENAERAHKIARAGAVLNHAEAAVKKRKVGTLDQREEVKDRGARSQQELASRRTPAFGEAAALKARITALKAREVAVKAREAAAAAREAALEIGEAALEARQKALEA